MSGTIQNSLRELRAERALTQQQLAASIGVSRQTLNAIEGGKYSPSLEAAFQLAEALGVTLEQIFRYVPAAKARKRPV